MCFLLSFFIHFTSHSLPLLQVTPSPILSLFLFCMCVVCTLCGGSWTSTCPEARERYRVSFNSICLIPLGRVFTDHGARLMLASTPPACLSCSLPSAAAGLLARTAFDMGARIWIHTCTANSLTHRDSSGAPEVHTALIGVVIPQELMCVPWENY